MPNIETITQKEKSLISVGASVAAGCQPCTAFHIKAAFDTGATEVEIRLSVDIAARVRKEAASIMIGVAAEHLGVKQPVENRLNISESLFDELVAVAASYAVSCKTGLEHHLQAARKAGAADRQILIALRLSRGIKQTAGKQVEAIAFFDETNTADDSSGGCGCQGSETENTGGSDCGCQESAVESSSNCGCA